jgi:mRNA interferase MazF
MAQETYSRGSIVLVRYPFTDLSGSKVRPAVIVTPQKYLVKSDDILCAFISSSIPDTLLPSDILIPSTQKDFMATGLKHTSVLRAHKLALLHKGLVLSKLGELNSAREKELNAALKDALGLS